MFTLNEKQTYLDDKAASLLIINKFTNLFKIGTLFVDLTPDQILEYSNALILLFSLILTLVSGFKLFLNSVNGFAYPQP